MTKWLFNSQGLPIAFISGSNVFSRTGRFIGRLDGNEIWHGRYIGEIVRDERFLRNRNKGSMVRGMPGTPGSPGVPGIPGSRGAIGILSGYSDVMIDA